MLRFWRERYTVHASALPGATLSVLVLIVIAAGHPSLAGRFAANENWTRFIGAVFLGVDRARRDPGQAVIVLATAIVYQLSIVGAYALIFRALDVSVPIAAAFAFVPAVSMLQVIPLFRPEILITAGTPVIAHATSNEMVTASNPAAAGEMLTLFATGLGATVGGWTAPRAR